MLPAGPARGCSLHGLGGAKDLPIPLGLAIAGATAALDRLLLRAGAGVAYAALPGRAARPPGPGVALGLVDSPGFQWTRPIARVAVLRLPGLGADLGTGPGHQPGAGHLLRPGLGRRGARLAAAGSGRARRQPGPHDQPAAVQATGGDPAAGLARYPERLGYWPAAAGLFAFVWQELVNPQSAYLGSVRIWLAIYLAVMLVGAAVFGDVWFARADPFEVYSSLVAKLSFWGRDGDRLVVRSPLANLATVVPRAGLLAVVSVLFGSTAFDSYKDTLPWLRFVQDVGLDPILTNSVALLVVLSGGRGAPSPWPRCRRAWRPPAPAPYAARRCRRCWPTR